MPSDGASLPLGHSESPSLVRVRAYAEARGLELVVSAGDQREPENVVALRNPGRLGFLIRRTSLDNTETAAFYLINSLEALGVDLDTSSEAVGGVERLVFVGNALASAASTAFWPEDVTGKATLRRALDEWKSVASGQRNEPAEGVNNA